MKNRVGWVYAMASATALPEPSETSRSGEVPPANLAQVGCSSLGGGSGLAVLALLGLLVRRRRR